ncbi:MAG: UvrD-helicase domain-containing protein, partial [Pseudomonas putida]
MHTDDLSLLLNSLNDAQRQAVAAKLGRQLVLAGAGSGKTRVLVHRIAWLIQVEQASPHSILSVTFTNKAAAEMRHRIEQLLGINPAGMWVGTFHGLAHRLLRAHWQEARLVQNFQILDSDDQQRLIKRVMRELGLDEQKWPARQAQWFINGQKDEGLRPQHIQAGGDLFLATMREVYTAYEQACERAGVIDFSELLLRALDLWRDHPGLLEHYQRRFQHVLVDEFQDTNAVQYAWLRLLARGGASLMAVGDDDQSIYGWRGAKIENIHQYTADFPDAEMIRLEQNYRSTGGILKAANALIVNNSGRLGKELWTDMGEGEPLTLYAAYNEHDEARYVVETIESLVKQGNARNEIAILYRSNAQSRVLEEALLRERIPYRIYGGQRFFERAEIKNAMAYLRLIEGRGNDAALERVINVPPRGIGEKTVEAIREHARHSQLSMWEAMCQL